MNNKEKYYQKIKKDLKANLEDEVDALMSTDIVALQLSTKEIAFSRAHSGWLFKEKRTEMIGSFLADFYCVTGLSLESKKRREHLTDEDLLENQLALGRLSKPELSQSNSMDMSNSISNSNSLNNNSNYSANDSDEFDQKPIRRKSLARPPKPNISWDDYIASEKTPCLGRKVVCKESVKKFKATLGMVSSPSLVHLQKLYQKVPLSCTSQSKGSQS